MAAEKSEARAIRLKSLGLFDEYQVLFDGLRQKGHNGWEAYRMAGEEYSEVRVGKKVEPQEKTQIFKPDAEKSMPAVAEVADLVTDGDCLWVYHNYGNGGAKADDAPSPGAWGLLKAAWSDQRAYLSVVDRVLPKGAVKEEDDSESQDLTGIKDLLKKHFGDFADEVLELAKGAT